MEEEVNAGLSTSSPTRDVTEGCKGIGGILSWSHGSERGCFLLDALLDILGAIGTSTEDLRAAPRPMLEMRLFTRMAGVLLQLLRLELQDVEGEKEGRFVGESVLQ